MADETEVGTELSLPHRAAAMVEVNGQEQVILWEPQGRFSITVPREGVTDLVNLGYRPYKTDLKQAAREIGPVFTAAREAVTAFGKTLDDGLDADAYAAAEAAVNSVLEAWSQLRDDAFRLHPPTQGAAVQVTDPYGRAWQVDPGQEQLYVDGGAGWRLHNLNPPTNTDANAPAEPDDDAGED